MLRQSTDDDVLCMPPIRPVPGTNASGNTRTHGIKISAAKRYPLAITRMERERTIENWAYSRIAVIESQTNIAVA